jgi:hypothetical protein
MTRLEHQMHTGTVHATRGWAGASRLAWRSLLATVGSAFALVLLAAPCYAQVAAKAAAKTSVSSLPSAEHGGVMRVVRTHRRRCAYFHAVVTRKNAGERRIAT